MCKNTGEDLKGKGPHLFQSSKVGEKKVPSHFRQENLEICWEIFYICCKDLKKVTTFSNYGFKVGLRQSIIIEPEQKKTNTVQKTIISSVFFRIQFRQRQIQIRRHKCHGCRKICCIMLPFYGNLWYFSPLPSSHLPPQLQPQPKSHSGDVSFSPLYSLLIHLLSVFFGVRETWAKVVGVNLRCGQGCITWK